MSMISEKQDAIWISNPEAQGSSENDWVEYQGVIDGVLSPVQILAGSNSTSLVCWDDQVTNGQDFVIRQDGTPYEGVANVTSSTEVEVDRVYGLDNLFNTHESFGQGQPTFNTASESFGVSNNGMFAYSSHGGNYDIYQHELPFPYSFEGNITLRDISNLKGISDNPTGSWRFNNSGSKAFLCFIDGGGEYIQEFGLTVAFDFHRTGLSNVTYGYKFYTPNYTNGEFDFDATGDNLYLLVSGGSIQRYTMTTPFDLSTATLHSSVSLSFTANSLSISKDGTKIYVTDANSAILMLLSTPYDIQSISSPGGDVVYNLETDDSLGTTYDTVRASNGAPSCLSKDADESHFYIPISVNNSGLAPTYYFYDFLLPADTVRSKIKNTIDLTNFGLSTTPQYAFGGFPDMKICMEDTAPRCVSRDISLPIQAVNADQVQVMFDGALDQKLMANDLVAINSGNVSVTSVVDSGTLTPLASYDNKSFDVSPQYHVPSSIAFNPTGTKMYYGGNDGITNTIYQYTLSTAWDVSTAIYDNVSVDPLAGSSAGLTFSADGSRLYTLKAGFGNSLTLLQWFMPTPWDITSIRFGGSINVQDDNRSVAFSPSGEKLYVVCDGTTDRVFQYSLSTPWDILTATYDDKYFYVGSEDSSPKTVVFNDIGTKCMILGSTSDQIYQYTLSAPWDISTATYDGVSFNPTAQDSAPWDIHLSADGLKMFVLGYSTDSVYQYSLGAPFSLAQNKIWNVNLPLGGSTPTFMRIDDRSELMAYPTTLVSGDVYSYSVSVSTTGSMSNTFPSQDIRSNPKRAVQLAAIGDTGTTVTNLTANLWKT